MLHGCGLCVKDARHWLIKSAELNLKQLVAQKKEHAVSDVHGNSGQRVIHEEN